MGIIKDTKENMFDVALSIASGGAVATYSFECDSSSDGGVIDVIIGGKTACGTT